MSDTAAVGDPQSMLRGIWALLTPDDRRAGWLIMGLMVVGMAFETVGVGLVIPVIGLLSQPDAVSKYAVLREIWILFGAPEHGIVIVGAMLVLVAVYACKSIFLGFLTWRQMRFAFGIQRQLSQRLFTSYLRRPYTFHLERNSAELIRNVTGEVQVFTFNAMLPGMQLLTEALVLFGLCVLLFTVEPVGTLIVLPVMGIAPWGIHYLMRGRILRWGEARQLHEGLRIQHLQQGLGGVKELMLLGREAEFLAQYEVHNAEAAAVGQSASTWSQLPRLWLEVLAVVGLAILVLAMVGQGRAVEAFVPTLALFTAAAFRLMPSLSRILASLQSLRYGLPVINTLNAELTPDSAPVSTVHVGSKRILHASLEMRNVTYMYPRGHQPALAEVSFEVRRGETIGFVGSSGAGKSTLVDVLLGLLIPSRGEVCVDGVDIRTCLREWQDQIGYVPQTIFLTDDSLRRNIAFGLPDESIDDAGIWRALRAAQLDTFVGELPGGIQTMVGERGIRLSGGQRQRIGIARALYHEPDVLVLDEATSALDTATETGVMQAVRSLHGAKTIFIVAHRFSTVEHCDRIYRLEKGSIVSSGSPTEMLAGPVSRKLEEPQDHA